jgi:transcriptional regulator with XRE-family HTH domain
MSLSQVIRDARKRKGFTQKELASRLGINKSEVSHYETQRRIPRARNLTKITEVLEISLETLLESEHVEKHGLLWGQVNKSYLSQIAYIPRYHFNSSESALIRDKTLITESETLIDGLYLWISSENADFECIKTSRGTRILIMNQCSGPSLGDIVLFQLEGIKHFIGEILDHDCNKVDFLQNGQKENKSIDEICLLGRTVKIALDF